MLVHAMILSAVISAPEPFKVEGGANVTIAKKTHYKLKCGEPLVFSAKGPGNLHIDFRGHADTKSAQVQLLRNDKFTSENQIALGKTKDGSKEFPVISELNYTVPAGEQKYALSCSEGGELAVFLDAPKKAVKTHVASAEKESAPPKPTASAGDAGGSSGDGYPFYYHPIVVAP